MDDVWLHVFSHLSPSLLLTCERVCQNWRQLTAETFAKYNSLDVERDFGKCIEAPEAMTNIVDRHSSALRSAVFHAKATTERHAVCASPHHLTQNVMRALCRRATRLRSLRIERMIITVAALEMLPELPETIEELSIVNCRMSCDSFETNQIVRRSFLQLLRKCTRLKKFEIEGRGYSLDHFELDCELLNSLPSTLHHLSISAGKALKIQDLNFLRDTSLTSFVLQRSFISSSDLSTLSQMANSLQVLDITSSINILDCRSIGEMLNLRELCVGNMRDGMDDPALISIVSNCRALSKLSLENCPKLTELSLSQLDRLSHLEWLCCSGHPSFVETVARSVSNCKKISFLDIKFCRNLSRDGLVYLLQLPLLTHLEVVGVPSFSPRLFEGPLRKPRVLISDNYGGGRIENIRLPPIPNTVQATA